MARTIHQVSELFSLFGRQLPLPLLKRSNTGKP
jgi:hypothetical protein